MNKYAIGGFVLLIVVGYFNSKDNISTRSAQQQYLDQTQDQVAMSEEIRSIALQIQNEPGRCNWNSVDPENNKPVALKVGMQMLAPSGKPFGADNWFCDDYGGVARTGPDGIIAQVLIGNAKVPPAPSIEVVENPESQEQTSEQQAIQLQAQ